MIASSVLNSLQLITCSCSSKARVVDGRPKGDQLWLETESHDRPSSDASYIQLTCTALRSGKITLSR